MKGITSRQKFFDFYSIIELYLRCGGFRDIGYQGYNTFVSFGIEERICRTYEQIVDHFYDEIYEALVTSLRSELYHYPSQCKYQPDKDIEVLRKHGITKEMTKSAKKFPERKPWVAYIIFSLPGWYCNPGSTAASYGGKKWARGAKLLMDARSIRTRMDKIYWIDRVLDLYHNGGHMINKTKYRTLSAGLSFYRNGRYVSTTPLNFRAKAKSIMDFIPFNSDGIRCLVIPRKNILTSTP